MVLSNIFDKIGNLLIGPYLPFKLSLQFLCNGATSVCLKLDGKIEEFTNC